MSKRSLLSLGIGAACLAVISGVLFFDAHGAHRIVPMSAIFDVSTPVGEVGVLKEHRVWDAVVILSPWIGYFRSLSLSSALQS